MLKAKGGFNGLLNNLKKTGDLVFYKSKTSCVGIVVEIGETMNKVRWFDGDLVEWMPKYSIGLLNERR